METSKLKRVRTVSETVEVDNSGDAARKVDISASVTVAGGKVTGIQSGTIRERSEGGFGGMDVGVFGFPGAESLDLHLYRQAEGATRTEIMAEVDEFAAQLKGAEF